MQIILTPEILLAAYSQGLFPMAESANNPYVHWFCPEMRGQLSVADMHIPRSLKKSVRQVKIKGNPYDIRINTDFKSVIKACAEQTNSRTETWINPPIIDAYCELHELGHAHSVECWQYDDLVGGLYGIAIGGAFFGESMFSRRTNASKVALVHLVARLYHAGYEILDTQFTNEHLEQFGVFEISYQDYMKQLEPALLKPCIFDFKDISERDLVLKHLSRQSYSSNKS